MRDRAIIEIREASKEYETNAAPVPALRPTTTSIADAAFVSIVGPSGCGKTTLLKMIGGLIPASTGEIRIKDSPVTHPREDVGFVFQSAVLLPWKTALENVLLPIQVRRRASAADVRRAEELLDLVGLSGFGGRYPHELSGGMQRRVALARAFSVNPRLLLLDEPFVSLDRTLVVEMEQVLLTLIETNRPTVLLVTHLPEDAATVADRAVVLSGRPAKIVADYRFASAAGQRPRAEREHIANQIAGAAAERLP